MAKKTTLRTPKINEQGEKEYDYIYPQTLADIVHLEDGTSVEEKISELEENSGRIKEIDSENDLTENEINSFVKNKEDGKFYLVDEHDLSRPISQTEIPVDVIKFDTSINLSSQYLSNYTGEMHNFGFLKFEAEDTGETITIMNIIQYGQLKSLMVTGLGDSFYPFKDGSWKQSEIRLPKRYVLTNVFNFDDPDFSYLYSSVTLETDTAVPFPKQLATIDDIDTAISQAITGVLEGEV